MTARCVEGEACEYCDSGERGLDYTSDGRVLLCPACRAAYEAEGAECQGHPAGPPFADGSGCEFCPAVFGDNVPAAPFEYYACSCCGHVETRQADVEAPARCEHCGAHYTALVSFGDLDAAEAFSEGLCNDLLDDAIERQTGRHPAR